MHLHAHGSRSHDHPHAHDAGSRVAWTLGLTLALMLVEFLGGLWTNSLALIADAGHMLSDAVALGATWWAIQRSRRPATPKRTFGERRAETLAALFNGATLLVVAGGVLNEAFQRLRSPEQIKAGPMLAIAVVGLAVNLAGLWLLHRDRHSSLNIEGAWQHVAGDAAGSLCAIIAALGVLLGGWSSLDAIASIAVTALILFGAIRLLRRTISVLMENAPDPVDVVEVRNTLLGTPGVEGVHCLHVWTISSGFHALTAHIVHQPAEVPAVLLERLHTRLGDAFPVDHVTLQLEPAGYARCAAEAEWCQP